MSNQRDFKNYYIGFITRFYVQDFPTLLSYTRFLEVMPSALVPLCAYFTHIKGKPTGIEFVDSTTLKVCHILRIPRHKVFEGIAKRGRGTMGGFDFKLHVIVNHLGDIVSVKLTPANVDDRTPVPEMARELVDKLYGDKGYLSTALSDTLLEEGVTLITNVRKNTSQFEHSRHRSMHGFMLNLTGGLIAYCRKPENQ